MIDSFLWGMTEETNTVSDGSSEMYCVPRHAIVTAFSLTCRCNPLRACPFLFLSGNDKQTRRIAIVFTFLRTHLVLVFPCFYFPDSLIIPLRFQKDTNNDLCTFKNN